MVTFSTILFLPYANCQLFGGYATVSDVNVSNANVGADHIGHATITVTVASIYLPSCSTNAFPNLPMVPCNRLLVGLEFSSYFPVTNEWKLLYANGTATSSPDPCNSTMIESQAASLAVCVLSSVAWNSNETVSFNLNQPGIDKGVQYKFVALAMEDSGIIGPNGRTTSVGSLFGSSPLLSNVTFTITFT